ncbi:Mif2/CENP-C like-domain-containing protein [Cubamyces lactineus]|nr:Mif2/CENP-C like-domain-containing protein [Cubamyces lactineus]
MPASARKSSLGNLRRGPQKYIPYRADDFQHGKKTGIAVGYVDRMSDEFEPFDKVISQADNRTPFRPQIVRKKRPKTPIVERHEPEEDLDGEMSMELEDSIPNSPSAYFAHTRVNTITSSVQRVGSSSRPVAHNSDVDFDEVPSPRASPSYTARKSLPHNRSLPSARPSRLSQSTVAQEDDGDDDSVDGGVPDYGDYGDYGNDMEDEEDHVEQDTRTPRNAQTPRRASFTQMAQEVDEEVEVEDEVDFNRSPSEKARGKQRASFVSPPPAPPDEDDMEPEIRHGLDEVDAEPFDEEQEPPSKKGGKQQKDKGKNARKENAQARAKPRQRRDVVLRELTPEDNTDGLRRSKRMRYSPLAWWRLEKVVYGRRESGKSLVPSIKEIHRIPQIKPEPLGARKRRGASRKKSRTAEPEAQQVVVYNPEEGWDDETDPYCEVLEYGEDGATTIRRIAFTAKMVQPKEAGQGAFYFQKVFGDGDFLAAGQLIIPPHSTKPTKGTKDNTFVFYVIQGAVKFAVHKTNFVLSTGGMFMVPRGNVYNIQNICDRDAKLFFAQARKMPEALADAEGEAPETGSRARSRSTAVVLRRESTGRASSDTVNAEEQPRSKSRRGTSAR